MKIKRVGRYAIAMQVQTREVIEKTAWPRMAEEMARDLHAYGFYEQFYAAEQLWAIEVGLAPAVADHPDYQRGK